MSWKSCTSCRKGIAFGGVYWECSVSTCNSKRMGLYFCTVACWDAHLPSARHRESWAVEKRAPSAQQAASQADSSPRQTISASPATSSAAAQPARRTVSVGPSASQDADLPIDVLVVVSKLKKYVKAKSDMNTSETAIPVLSQELRRICDRAIRIAGESGRKTIMDRDIRDALKQ